MFEYMVVWTSTIEEEFYVNHLDEKYADNLHNEIKNSYEFEAINRVALDGWRLVTTTVEKDLRNKTKNQFLQSYYFERKLRETVSWPDAPDISIP